jgi:3-isopropylmalate/(R)-2-methylmalate dehydratase small subunit
VTCLPLAGHGYRLALGMIFSENRFALFGIMPEGFRARQVRDTPSAESARPCDEIGASMDKFTILEGVAAPLKIINVDTDMIIPKQYLKTIKRTGLGKGLFSEQRYRDDGSENPDFVLNQKAYRNAKILVADDNFGCGSSREHAPWALLDFGIRCVISTSFGDIFYNNCFKNGILPIRVSPEDLAKLFDDAERGANATLTIDLARQEIRGPDGGTVKFDIDPHRKHCLLNGLDDIALSLEKKPRIDSYESKMKAERPWA